MRYMTVVKSKENAGPPPMSLMVAIGQLGDEATRAGVLVETGGLMGTSHGALLRLSADGDISITDGPFSEAKEVIGGYAVYDVKSKDEMLHWTRRFIEIHREHWKGFECEIEVRQIMEFPPQPR